MKKLFWQVFEKFPGSFEFLQEHDCSLTPIALSFECCYTAKSGNTRASDKKSRFTLTSKKKNAYVGDYSGEATWSHELESS